MKMNCCEYGPCTFKTVIITTAFQSTSESVTTTSFHPRLLFVNKAGAFTTHLIAWVVMAQSDKRTSLQYRSLSTAVDRFCSTDTGSFFVTSSSILGPV